MIKLLTRHFISFHHNDQYQHTLRVRGVGVIGIFLIFTGVFLSPLLVFGAVNMSPTSISPAVLVELANNERKIESISPLTVSPLLNDAAQAKAMDMASKGYFAHTSPEGRTPWYWLDQAGYRYQYAGENLAINFTTSAEVVHAWMASPTHRANIVKGNYTEVGTGMATGIYEGRETIFVVQVYGGSITNNTNVQNSNVKKINVQNPPEQTKIPAISVENPVKQTKVPVKIKSPVAKKTNIQKTQIIKEQVTKQPVIKKKNTEVLGIEAITKITPLDKTSILPQEATSSRDGDNTDIFLAMTFAFIALGCSLRVRQGVKRCN